MPPFGGGLPGLPAPPVEEAQEATPEQPVAEGTPSQDGTTAPVPADPTANLNGAQIQSVIAILDGVAAGTIAQTAAVELIMATGVTRVSAQRMVGDQDDAKPEAQAEAEIEEAIEPMSEEQKSAVNMATVADVSMALRGGYLTKWEATKTLQAAGMTRKHAERLVKLEVKKANVLRTEGDLYETKEEAERIAEILGCEGHHTHDVNGRTMYMPCGEMSDYTELTGEEHSGDDDLDLVDAKAVGDIDLKPSETMSDLADRGLKLREEHGRGGTEIGVARARDIKNRDNLSPETVGRMVNFFSRHRVDLDAPAAKPSHKEYPSAGVIAWLLWGGDPADPEGGGHAWAKEKLSLIERERDGQKGGGVTGLIPKIWGSHVTAKTRAALGRVILEKADDCGTGAGGFKPGNDCAEGHGRPPKPENIGDLKDSLKDKYPLEKLSLYERGDHIELMNIEVEDDAQGQGVGTDAMDEIKDYAQDAGKPIVLTAEASSGSREDLDRFYESLGFESVESGGSRDYSLPAHTHIWKPEESKDKPKTETPEFKEWIGQSVEQDDGKPRVLYHGTAGVFDEFSEGVTWVSEEEDHAQLYADAAESMSGNQGGVIPLYVRSERPVKVSDRPKNVKLDTLANELLASARKDKNTFDIKEARESLDKFRRGWESSGSDAKQERPRHEWWFDEGRANANEKNFAKLVQSLGYDSVEYYETIGGYRGMPERKIRTVGVFDSNQLKSSSDNDGNFSRDSGDITKSADNCGTGAGGFQAGNDCAEGHGRPEAGTEKVRTGEVTQEERDAYDKFAKRNEVDDQGRTSAKAWKDGDDWTSPDGLTYEHDETNEEIGTGGMGQRLFDFCDQGEEMILRPDANNDIDLGFNQEIMDNFETDARDLSDEDTKLIEGFTAHEYQNINSVMRKGSVPWVAQTEEAFARVEELAWDAGALSSSFDIDQMSDSEVVEFATVNQEFTEKIHEASKDLRTGVDTIETQAIGSSFVYTAGNRYRGMGDAKEYASGIEDSAYALSLENAKNNPSEYRESLSNLLYNMEEFDRPFSLGIEEIESGYQDAGRRIDNLVDAPLRADGKPMTVYRANSTKGVGSKRLYDAINSGVKTYKLDGVASASTDGMFASDWSHGDHQVVMRMKVTNGLFVGPISSNPRESEVILPRGTEFKINSVERLSSQSLDESHGTVIVVDMEAIQ